MTKLLVCNIGWMKNYQGITDTDAKPKGGGSYNEKKMGHEACNFLACENGLYYGYVQPNSEIGSIDTARIGGRRGEPITGVTVVWIARNPDPTIENAIIVGWYNNATVYPKFEKHVKLPSKIHQINSIEYYNITVNANDVVFIPENERNIEIPRTRNKDISGIGQSNVWYIDKEKDLANRERIIAATLNRNFSAFDNEGNDYFAIEGKDQNTQHVSKSRNAVIIQKKKKQVLQKTGKLECEACGFNFKEFYAKILEHDFCEIHHRTPLSSITSETQTTLDDLAVLCSNCHRVIHKTSPMMKVEELAKKIRK